MISLVPWLETRSLPLMGNFADLVYLNVHVHYIRSIWSHVCTLAVGALERNAYIKYVTLSFFSFNPYTMRAHILVAIRPRDVSNESL